MARKPKSDFERFNDRLKKVAGAPHVRWKEEYLGTPWEQSTEISRWWCPSCRTPHALQLEHPVWLPYPQPHCWNCSDVEVYEALGLQELAFRGDSPPFVMCNVVQSYRKKTGRWPQIGTEKGQWIGSCRTCSGCREFTTQRQAHMYSVGWTEHLATAADRLHHRIVWEIEVPETDKRRVLDVLTYRMNQHSGALCHIPVEDRRIIFAAVESAETGRVTPTLRRLLSEAVGFTERREQRTESIVYGCWKTHEHGFGDGCIDCDFPVPAIGCDPGDGHLTHTKVQTYGVRVTLEEQLEPRIFDTIMRRVWSVDGRAAKIGFRHRPIPSNDESKDPR